MIAVDVTTPFAVKKPTKARPPQIIQNPVRVAWDRTAGLVGARMDLGSVVDMVSTLSHIADFCAEQIAGFSHKALSIEKYGDADVTRFVPFSCVARHTRTVVR